MTAPTIGSNVEEVQSKNIKVLPFPIPLPRAHHFQFVMWDLGGQESSRASWATYYKQTNAIVMVIDSTDRDRIGMVSGNNSSARCCTAARRAACTGTSEPP